MGQLTYTLAVQNGGAQPVADVTLYPVLPATVELLTLDSHCRVGEGAITCPLGVIAPNAAFNITLIYRPTMAGSLTLSAELTSRAPEGHLTNQQVNATVMVQPAADGCVLQPWRREATYGEGDQVCHTGHFWQARWWTYDEEPGQAAVWFDLGPCTGQAAAAGADNVSANALSFSVPPTAQLFLPLVLR
ncbi:MAG: hypothetical protein DYG89_30155 [Caldilinea sp. CFX5]|nr:hypothetical protein [Caldilinea sp. CFX5]